MWRVASGYRMGGVADLVGAIRGVTHAGASPSAMGTGRVRSAFMTQVALTAIEGASP